MFPLHITTLYEKGISTTNEDRYLCIHEKGIFAVMDGATGLGKLTGELAAQTICDRLQEIQPEENLLDVTLSANQLLGKRVRELMGVDQVEEIPKTDRSTTGLVAVRFLENNTMEYVHSGDCMIMVEYEEGVLRMLTHDSLSRLDEIAIRERAQLLQEKAGDENPNGWSDEKRKQVNQEIWQELQEVLQRNRNLLNTKEGYPVLDGSKKAEQMISYGLIPLIRARKILLLSDGLVLPHQKASADQMWIETAKLAFSQGLPALYEQVQSLEEADPMCYLYPRFKKADDKTGILIELNKNSTL
ncbi:protein phosphatase 2C domain-containing protein [Risungbinella massiliensis]|uniref:protein phosphatase 2C domain-containing protein n=1 Tax=Risungbinella massiliensis TaxID=1329796 RepID=UPI0005CBA668|nr:protein phosphatase 2C domain-containing protein [Risungbinella massiliensis]